MARDYHQISTTGRRRYQSRSCLDPYFSAPSASPDWPTGGASTFDQQPPSNRLLMMQATPRSPLGFAFLGAVPIQKDKPSAGRDDLEGRAFPPLSSCTDLVLFSYRSLAYQSELWSWKTDRQHHDLLSQRVWNAPPQRGCLSVAWRDPIRRPTASEWRELPVKPRIEGENSGVDQARKKDGDGVRVRTQQQLVGRHDRLRRLDQALDQPHPSLTKGSRARSLHT